MKVRFPISFMRILALALIAVLAAGYALLRYRTRPRPPMLVPPEAPRSHELPAPELER